MLQLLYLMVFTLLLVVAVMSLVQNLMMFAGEAQKPSSGWSAANRSQQRVPHPEFLDNAGNVVNEPLLVMRSVSVEDLRDRLDALYDASPGVQEEDS